MVSVDGRFNRFHEMDIPIRDSEWRVRGYSPCGVSDIKGAGKGVAYGSVEWGNCSDCIQGTRGISKERKVEPLN